MSSVSIKELKNKNKKNKVYTESKSFFVSILYIIETHMSKRTVISSLTVKCINMSIHSYMESLKVFRAEYINAAKPKDTSLECSNLARESCRLENFR